MQAIVQYFPTQAFASGIFIVFGHRHELVHKIVKIRRIEPLPSNAIFMIFWSSLSQALSRRFVGFDDAGVF